jgi:3-oxoacyl-[acyl-carrier-protein] synthase-3
VTVRRSIVGGCGAYLPARVVDNAELSCRMDTSDEWIMARTGIRERRIAADGELTSDLAVAAAERAMAAAGVGPDDIDLVVLATATPDQTFPATATAVQARLGIRGGAAFDVQAVCSGFVFGLAVADNFIRVGQSRRALVIGAETFSRILDWDDRTTAVLFGDGAGAVVLHAGEGAGDSADRGILTTYLRADGRFGNLLYVDGGPSSTRTTGHLRMEGPEVFRHAVTNLAEAVRAALDDPPTRAAVTAERTVLAELEAGCSAPVGALAEVAEGDDGEELWLRAVALARDGGVSVRRSATGTPGDAGEVGRRLGKEMLADGAGSLIEEKVS